MFTKCEFTAIVIPKSSLQGLDSTVEPSFFKLKWTLGKHQTIYSDNH